MVTRQNLKLVLAAAFFVMAGAGVPAGSALELSDLLFYAPFNGDTTAQVAGGSKKPTAGTVEFAAGICGQGALIGGDGKNVLKYPTAGNFNKDAGTMSLWIKPVDWKRADGKGHTFLVFPGEGPVVQCYQLYNYSVGWTWFMMIRTGGNNRFIGPYEPDWKPGEWHQLAATWQKNEVCVYVDGELQARETDDIPLLEKAGAEFAVGDAASQTVFDELMIFKRPLMPVEVKALYQKNAPEKKGASSRITMSKTATAPTIDGVLAPGEWDQAAAVGNLTETFWGELIKEPSSTMRMTFDEKNLYFSLRFAIPEVVRRSPATFPRGPLKCEVRERDGEVLTDDCFEILLSPEGSGAQPVYCLAMNALGVVFDAKDGQKSWNANAVVKSRIDANEWILEAAIPFADLGVAVPANGAKWRFNLAQHWKALNSQSGTVVFSGDAPNAMGELVFAAQAPVVQVSGIGPLDQGQMLVEGRVSNPGTTAVAVTLTAQTSGKEINETTTLKLAPGTSQSFQLRSALTKALASTLVIEGRDAAGNRLYLTRFPFVFRPSLLVKLHNFPIQDKLVVEINRTGADTSRGAASVIAEVNLRDRDSGKSVKHLRTTPFTQGKTDVTFDLTGLDHGWYDVAVSLATAERKLGEEVVPFEKQKLPKWLNNKDGISEKVPPPWSPLDVQQLQDKKGVAVNCWGRQYQFKEGLFPSQVVTQGKPLLASPMRLMLKSKGSEAVELQGTVAVTEAKENQVKLETTGMMDDAGVSVKTTIEYDGFVWFDLTINPKDKMTIESLAFEMPYASEYASLFYSMVGNGNFDDVGLIKSTGYQGNPGSFFWVGCEDGGIEWVSESQQGWKIAKPQQTLQIIRDAKHGKDVLVRLNIVDVPKQIDRPLTISFGLQATPVRPKPAGWRKWRISSSEHPKAEQPSIEAKPWIIMWNLGWSKNVDCPVITPEWKKVLQRRESEGTRSLLYTQIMRTSPLPPEYRYFYEEWRMTPSAEIDFDTIFDKIKNVGWDFQGCGPVCVKSSYADFYMWNLKRSVEKADIKGIYYDLTGPEPCSNQAHGCGWVDDDGQVQAVWPIRAVREFVKRVYVVLKEHDPAAIIGMHMSGRNLMPMNAFCDMMVDGELFNQGIQQQIASKGQDNYYALLPLDKMRAQYMSHHWGPLTAFLPAFVPGAGEKYHQDALRDIASIEHLVGLFLLHDSQIWPAWMNGKPLFDIWAAQEKFGWDDDVEFIPYWDKRVSEYVTLETGGVQPVVCSIFKRHGKVMLVPFNNSDTDADVMIRLHGDKMGLSNGTFTNIRDFYSGGFWYNVPGEGSAWKLSLRKRNFRMLVPQP